MSFFSQESVTKKNNMLIIVTISLLLLMSIFVMAKFENLLGVFFSLSCIILAGTILILFIE